MKIIVTPLDSFMLCESDGIIFIFMSVQKVGEIFIWKTSNFLSGAFLLPFSIYRSILDNSLVYVHVVLYILYDVYMISTTDKIHTARGLFNIIFSLSEVALLSNILFLGYTSRPNEDSVWFQQLLSVLKGFKLSLIHI